MSSKGKAAPARKGKAPAKPAKEAASSKPADEQPPILEGVKTTLKECFKILEESPLIEKSGRWPLVVDLNGNVCTFLRHRNANCLCAANGNDMNEETIRMALLGALRYGKAFVIDLLDVDLIQTVEEQLNKIQPDLAKDLFSKKLMENENFLKLYREGDDDAYSPKQCGYNSKDFQLIVVTTKDPPYEKLLRQFFPVTVQQ